MKWKFVVKRAMEAAFWTLVPAMMISVHFAVWWKLSFLQQHPEFSIANATAESKRAEDIWRLAQNHPGWFACAIVLIPSACCFAQHLGLRWWWRMVICLTISLPALWYVCAVLQIARKVLAVEVPSP